jgi:hypothetical protein
MTGVYNLRRHYFPIPTFSVSSLSILLFINDLFVRSMIRTLSTPISVVRFSSETAKALSFCDLRRKVSWGEVWTVL